MLFRSVKIAGGQTLVDGNDYKSLECVARKDFEKVNQSDIDGLYDVYWGDGQKFNLYSGAMGGELKGLVDLRDGNNGESFAGQVTGVGSVTANGVTQSTVTIDVNKHYLTDLNKCNLSDQGGVIKLGNQEFYYDSWTYSVSYDNNGEPNYSYTFTISGPEKNGTKTVIGGMEGKTATIGTSINYQGVPYYMAQMNEWVRTFSQKFNDIVTSGYSGTEQGIKMFTASMPTDDKQYNLPDDKRYDTESYEAYLERVKALEAGGMSTADAMEAAKLTVSVGMNNVTEDSYFMMTALNVDILTALELDPSRLANKKELGDGVEQIGRAHV